MPKNIIKTPILETPIGKMFAASTNIGICLLMFYNRQTIKKNINTLEKMFDAQIIPSYNNYFETLSKELKEYFKNNLQTFTTPLHLKGTPFQMKAWKMLQTIPYAQTISYQEQAKLLNNPKAIRAVANANANNLISILIPCHRVIGKNGTLRGYAGGIDKKKFLLNLEKKTFEKIKK